MGIEIGFKKIGMAFLSVAISVATHSLIAQEAVPEKPLAEAEETPTPEPAARPKERTSEQKGPKLIQEMTAEEKTAAGLDKLSPAELEYLDEWVRNYRRMGEKKAAEKAAAETKVEATKEATEKAKRMIKRDVIVSRVDGVMVPLTGRTVIKLEDGSRWKQANKEDRFRPRMTDRPPAAVIHTTFGFKMRVEGMPDFYVDPVRE